MSKFLRALLISAVATTLATMTARMLSGSGWSKSGSQPRSEPDIDADELAPEQRDLLISELDAQL